MRRVREDLRSGNGLKSQKRKRKHMWPDFKTETEVEEFRFASVDANAVGCI